MDPFEDKKLRIKEATDIVALIESYMPLRPRGRLLQALCPFHAENSPSFTVYRESQSYYCFGCGKSGDAFTWLMERDGLTFREAMEVLADRAGISLDGVFQRERQKAAGPDPFETLAEVAGFFQATLLAPAAGRLAREYLEQRGLADAIGPWRLGCHPPAGALLQFAQQKKLPLAVLESAGLLRHGRELFAHRLMFPIEDERGRTVGFGGRIVPGAPGSDGDGERKPPKYLNSPESPFFNKRRVLFGLHKAKQAHQRRILVTEGYTDVIACHLAGFQGAVATLGTAFTAEHARTVERYATEGLVLMFDGDRAGAQAAERAMRELVNSRLTVRIAMMGDADGGAKDPADVVVARPGEDPELVTERRARFGDAIDGAEDCLVAWFRLLRRRLDFTQSAGVEAAAQECGSLLALVESPVRRAALLEQMARHLAVPAAALERQLQRLRPKSRPSTGPAGPVPEPPPRTPLGEAETAILACVLAAPRLLAQFDAAGGGAPGGAPLSAEHATLLAWAGEGVAAGRTDPAALMRYLMARAAERPDLQACLGRAHQRSLRLPDPDAVLAGLLQGRRRLAGESERRAVRQQLQEALATGDAARAAALQKQLLSRLREAQPRHPSP
jgi:DNA primase